MNYTILSDQIFYHDVVMWYTDSQLYRTIHAKAKGGAMVTTLGEGIIFKAIGREFTSKTALKIGVRKQGRPAK